MRLSSNPHPLHRPEKIIQNFHSWITHAYPQIPVLRPRCKHAHVSMAGEIGNVLEKLLENFLYQKIQISDGQGHDILVHHRLPLDVSPHALTVSYRTLCCHIMIQVLSHRRECRYCYYQSPVSDQEICVHIMRDEVGSRV